VDNDLDGVFVLVAQAVPQHAVNSRIVKGKIAHPMYGPRANRRTRNLTTQGSAQRRILARPWRAGG